MVAAPIQHESDEHAIGRTESLADAAPASSSEVALPFSDTVQMSYAMDMTLERCKQELVIPMHLEAVGSQECFRTTFLHVEESIPNGTAAP